MRVPRTGVRLVALGATLALTGCAPGFGIDGTGFRLGITPGLGLDLAPASCLLLGTSMPAELALQAGGAAQAGARMQQIAQTQARYSLGYNDPATRTEGWKRLAGGGC